MPFQVSVGGRVLTTEDLTLDEIAVIESEVGEPWLFIVSAPAKSARHAKAILAAVLARGMDADKASAQAGGMTMREVLAAFELVEDDRPVEHNDGVPVVDPPVGTAGPATT